MLVVVGKACRVAHWLPGWVRVSAWLVAACMLLSCIQLRLASRNAVAFAQWPLASGSPTHRSSLLLSRVLAWERAYSGVTVTRAVPLAVGRRALTSALFDLVPVFYFIFQRYSWLLGHRAFQQQFREIYR